MKNGLKKSTIPIKNAMIYLNKFNEEEAAASLDWAIKFWKSERDAISTSNHNKCWICARASHLKPTHKHAKSNSKEKR